MKVAEHKIYSLTLIITIVCLHRWRGSQHWWWSPRRVNFSLMRGMSRCLVRRLPRDLFSFAERYICREVYLHLQRYLFLSSVKTLINGFSGDLPEASRSSWCLEGDGRQILNVQNTSIQNVHFFPTPRMYSSVVKEI